MTITADFLAAFHNTLLFPIPVAILFSGALVVQLFALGQTDFELGAPFFPVQRQGYQSVTLAFDMTDEPAQLLPMQEQFAGTHRIGNDMGGSGGEGLNM